MRSSSTFLAQSSSTQSFRDYFVGMEVPTPCLDGQMRPYVNLDNAASTPPMKAAQDAVDRFGVYYSSVHRGTGFKSQLSTHAFEKARQKVIEFLGGNLSQHVCIFGKNTTEAVNKLARRFPFTPKQDTVLVSTMEHHSNDLPWRAVANVVHIAVRPDGSLDEDDFDALLERYAGRLALVAITGASNVTGIINPARRLAEKTHAAGAQIAVDCAQLAPHRKIDMLPLEDPAHYDYVTISAHKMYAPYGTGALIGRRDTFEQGEPDLRGGGQVEIVTLDNVYWSEPPDREEAGSPNTVGAIALAAAICELDRIGMDVVARHEAELTEYLLSRLSELPMVTIYGDRKPHGASQRLGVVPFNLCGMNHFLVAAILGYEFGIGVRNGCFCAHPYLLELLNVHEEQAQLVRRAINENDRRDVPGMVRISFGLYNITADIDALINALQAICRGEYQGVYEQSIAEGTYQPQGWQVDYDQYFSFDGRHT